MSTFYDSLNRLRRGIRFGTRLANTVPDAPSFEQRLDQMYKSGDLDRFYVEKAKQDDPNTRLKVHKTTSDLTSFYSSLFRAVHTNGEIPPMEDAGRDEFLADFWQHEPILSGAVYSMSAKMTALRWTVSGRKTLANYYANLLSRAISMGGMDWGDFISPSAQDFYTTNRGVFWEAARKGDSQYGRLDDLAHIDALCCNLTGNSQTPMVYWSDTTGQRLDFRQGEYIHFSSLPSARERRLGSGFCAVDRAYRAARLLLGLHKYDEEKLNNLPPEGVAAVSGLTMDEFQDALALWATAREKNKSLTFPQVLWLLGSQPGSEVKLDIHGFSQFPESFSREIVVVQYVNILALVFGVDAREFWPISTSSMGTAAESEIQHMKARGKGPGEFISIVERKINAELENGVKFAFDTQDIDEDLKAAEVAKGWVEALLPLTQAGGGAAMQQQQALTTTNGKAPLGAPPALPQAPPSPDQKPFLSRENFLRLLADRGVIPNYMVEDDRAVVFDSSIQEKGWGDDEYAEYKWDRGVLSFQQFPITIRTTVAESAATLPLAEVGHSAYAYDVERLKQVADDILDSHRNIRGKPIPDSEALRGNAATRRSVEEEIERWRAHPILSQYVPTTAEGDIVEKILENVNTN